MKKLLLGAAAAALLAGPALAQTANQTVAVGGTQPSVCTMTLDSATGTGSMAASGLTSTVTFNSANAVIAAGQLTASWTGMCNYNHAFGLRSANGGMVNASAVSNAPRSGSGTFVTRLGYTANASWSTLDLSLGNELTFPDSNLAAPVPVVDTARTFQSAPVGGASRGPLEVILNIPAGTLPVVAGVYSDSMIVQLGAAI
ncbi:hypothetical protein [Brevundimonas sp.]|uniref:hypothetical protein n=1 Tax=Brevundimonas sp. TaxID=1871086 RepID=UPI003F6FDD83